MISELLLVSTIILICILFNRFSDKYGIPLLMFFIVFGMAFGTDGLRVIEFDDYNIAKDICTIGLIFIMFYGGFGTNWKFAKPVAVLSGVLATLGVALTALFTGLFCYFALGMQKLESFLIGAVISSTDAASVFSILRAKKLALRYNTASLLEMESGSNDPMSYLLTILALSLMQGDYSAGLIKLFFTQILFGVFFGVLFALLSIHILRKADLNKNGFDSMFVLALALLSYAVPSALDGNGYLSVYICGIILGNTPFKNKIQLVHFFDGLTGLSQILLFFMLGLLASPSALLTIWKPAVAIALFLTLIGRPPGGGPHPWTDAMPRGAKRRRCYRRDSRRRLDRLCDHGDRKPRDNQRRRVSYRVCRLPAVDRTARHPASCRVAQDQHGG